MKNEGKQKEVTRQGIRGAAVEIQQRRKTPRGKHKRRKKGREKGSAN